VASCANCAASCVFPCKLAVKSLTSPASTSLTLLPVPVMVNTLVDRLLVVATPHLFG